MAKIQLWAPPKALIEWTTGKDGTRVGERVCRNRSQNCLEMFLDLIYVSAAIRVANLIKNDLKSNAQAAVFAGIACWSAIFQGWIQHTQFHTRFGYEDYANRSFLLMSMLGLVGAAINIPETIPLSDADPNFEQLKDEARGFSASMILLAAGELLLFTSAVCSRWKMRYYAGCLWYAPRTLALIIYVVAFFSQPKTAAILLFASAFVQPVIMLAGFGAMVTISKQNLDEGSRRFSFVSKIRSGFMPLDIEHVSTRNGELIML